MANREITQAELDVAEQAAVAAMRTMRALLAKDALSADDVHEAERAGETVQAFARLHERAVKQMARRGAPLAP